jgi:hypothetical protein
MIDVGGAWSVKGALGWDNYKGLTTSSGSAPMIKFVGPKPLVQLRTC